MSILMHGIQMPKSCSECKLDLRTDICKAFCEWSAEHPYSRRATDRLLDCPLSEVSEPCEDAVSRQAVSSWLKQYGQDVLHGKYKFSLMYIWKNLMDLPSAQPEIVLCKECKNWVKGYITDQDDFIPPKCGKYQQMVGHSSNDYCSLAKRRTDE